MLNQQLTSSAKVDQTINTLVGQACTFGYDALRIEVSCVKPSRNPYYARLIEVNGELCQVHLLSAEWHSRPHARHGYCCVSFTYELCRATDFTLLWTDVPGYCPRIFVIPSEEVLKTFFNVNRKRAKMYVPLAEPQSYDHRPPKLKVWQYEGAWHLFNRKRKMAAMAGLPAIPA